MNDFNIPPSLNAIMQSTLSILGLAPDRTLYRPIFGVSFALSDAGGVIPQIYIGDRTRWSQGVKSPGRIGRSGRRNSTFLVFPSR